MKKFFRLGVIKESEDIQALEDHLRVALIAVEPRSEYVHGLRRTLIKEGGLEISAPKPSLVQNILLTAAGVLSGALLLALGVRGVIALLNSRGVVQQLKNAVQGKKAAPLNPVA